MTLVAAKCVSDHVEDLADGRQVAPGEIIEGVETKEPHNKRLFKESRLLRLTPKQADEVEDDHEVIPPPDQPPKLEGKALQDRAQELDIQGRNQMSADQLRAAVAEAEKEADQ